MKTTKLIAAALLLPLGTAMAVDNTWNGTNGDWVSDSWSLSPGAPMVDNLQDLIVSSGSMRLTDNNTWIDNDPSRFGRWGGSSMALSGTGAIQHYGRRGLRVGERGNGLFTQTGGTHYLTSSTTGGTTPDGGGRTNADAVNLRIGSQNGGGSGTYNMSGGLLTNVGAAAGFTVGTGNGGVNLGSGGTGVMTLSGNAVVALTAPLSSGGPAFNLGDLGSATLNIIGTGVSVSLHSLQLEGLPGENTIGFELDGGDVSPIDVSGAGGGVAVINAGTIALSNYAGVTTPTTIDLINSENGFSNGAGLSLDAAAASAGWSLEFSNGGSTLQASFIPEPGSALLLGLGSLLLVGRRRRA